MKNKYIDNNSKGIAPICLLYRKIAPNTKAKMIM